MNSDQELLELAAKAAGYRVCHFHSPVSVYVSDDLRNAWFFWAPLSNNADALRLAVQLNIAIDPMVPDLQNCNSDEKFSVALLPNKMRFSVLHGDDAEKATRRAITRAAAEIGRAKP